MNSKNKMKFWMEHHKRYRQVRNWYSKRWKKPALYQCPVNHLTSKTKYTSSNMDLIWVLCPRILHQQVPPRTNNHRLDSQNHWIQEEQWGNKVYQAVRNTNIIVNNANIMMNQLNRRPNVLNWISGRPCTGRSRHKYEMSWVRLVLK